MVVSQYCFFVTVEDNNKRGPPFYVDMVVEKINSSKTVVMVIEVKRVISLIFKDVQGKSILELLLLVIYTMTGKGLTRVCGVLTDIAVWHCLSICLLNNKIFIERYITFST